MAPKKGQKGKKARVKTGQSQRNPILVLGSVPTTPEPYTSAAKASRYKWEPYRDANSWCIKTTFCQEEGMFLQTIAIEIGGVSRYFSKVSGFRGRLDSPDLLLQLFELQMA